MYLRLFTVTCWGIPSSLRASNLSADFYSPFDLVVDPYELHTRAYPPSLGSLDLSQASLYFDLVVNPHELSYWGISSPTEFACIIILVILWRWATWLDHHHVSSIRVGVAPISIGHSSCQFSLSFGAAPLLIGHLPVSLCLVQVGTAPISIGHLPISLYSVWVGTASISISHLPISLCSVWVGTSPISIGHRLVNLSLDFEVAPISIGHLSINSVQFEFWGRTYIDLSFILSVQLELGPHLYQSVIFLSVWVFGTAPISIDHCLISLSLGF